MSPEGKIIAIIPARGGSKEIPQKNIIDFCQKPLIFWTIQSALKSKKISDVYVSTDDKKIGAVAKKYGAKVIWRPKEISGDFSPSEDALKHAVSEIRKKDPGEINYVVFLQVTSPLREAGDIDRAVSRIIKGRADSLFSGAELGDFYIWRNKKGKLESLNYDYKRRGRRQEFGKQFVENGSIYIFKPEVLFKYNNRLAGKILIFEMELWKSFEIDSWENLKLCEEIFKIKSLDKK